MNIQNILNIFKPKIDQKHIIILAIEDNEVDQRIISAAVEQGGYRIVQAYDGKTGLELAMAHKPNLIILDYMLPDTKGPEICETLKNNPATKHIPVLFLTSIDTPGGIINCYEKGGENYLSKPISIKLLLKHIELTLKDKQQEK